MLRKVTFLVGLFLLCACVLILQIVETRILSVISYYHLAFFAISLAMFGMTAGSLIVYFNQVLFSPERLLVHLSWIAAAFGVSVVLSTVVLISTVLLTPPVSIILSATLWLKLIAALVPPYVFAGMAISLALTRSPWPVGLVYGSDLAGAAFGCLGALTLMSTLDGVSAMLMVGAVGAGAAFALSRSWRWRSGTRRSTPTAWCCRSPRRGSRTRTSSSTRSGTPIRVFERRRSCIRARRCGAGRRPCRPSRSISAT